MIQPSEKVPFNLVLVLMLYVVKIVEPRVFKFPFPPRNKILQFKKHFLSQSWFGTPAFKIYMLLSSEFSRRFMMFFTHPPPPHVSGIFLFNIYLATQGCTHSGCILQVSVSLKVHRPTCAFFAWVAGWLWRGITGRHLIFLW